eukprot:CAMPEP_0115083102 /NCGR_PEP_ID=MMETSP0227-20121206/20324_1 /TAXON_ID=89957 /ORGANISM="Polarella glacialis, Strain CCMP 1383" /LENGTH=509 /DNA_ID=CAMNT_0002471373 /DNA_START=78 /DNA_END=1607 /DNA_ORIENTATION=-
MGKALVVRHFQPAGKAKAEKGVLKAVKGGVLNGGIKQNAKGVKRSAAQVLRRLEDAAEAKAAAKMTSEQWKNHQLGMATKWPAPSYMAVDHGKGHMSFRDETFEIVSRWKAETRISYRPHAKSPGSKSHVRYEKYAKATTAGQALKQGSLPADWCWDYERGYIKVLGRVRDEPLDISKIQDESSLTDVDRVVHSWYRKEIAKKLGLSYADLIVDKGGMETTMMRARRLVAQREAKKRLEDARKHHRKISDKDVEQTLQEWAFAKNPNRTNVIPEGQEWVLSDTLGLLRDRCGDIHLTSATLRYPDVTRIISQWLKDRLSADAAKKFTFTSLNLNCNYAARRHRDGNNFGPSFIAAFGPFTGGELNYWPEDDQACKVEKLEGSDSVAFDLNRGLALFNGNCAHSVNDFEGSRYSVVYFTLGCHAKMPQKARDELKSLGVFGPAPGANRYTLLRPPHGITGKKAPSKATKNGLPAFRYLPRTNSAPSKVGKQAKKAGASNVMKKQPASAKS